MRFADLANDAPGIELNFAMANVRKIMFNQIIIERPVVRQNVFQQFVQSGNVPLAVAQFAEWASYGLFSRHFKVLVKRAAGSNDLQFVIEYDKRLAYRIDDAFGQLSRFLYGYSPCALGDVGEG